MSTEALRIYLAYLRDKRRMAVANSNAFVSHWLSFEEFDELERLVLAQCDFIDAQTENIRVNNRAIRADNTASSEEIRSDSNGSVRKVE